MNHAMTKHVSRATKRFSKAFTRILLAMSILFIFMGIILDRGMLFLSMLSVLLYWYSSYESIKDYEYHMEGNKLTVDVIKGKQRRKRMHELDLSEMEVLAPNWHEAVSKYRKNGGTEQIKKYDYTSYDDAIPFYTMIIYSERTKIKILLNLDEEWLWEIKRQYPTKVYMGEKA